MASLTVASPLGPLTVDEAGGAIVSLTFGGGGGGEGQATPLLHEAAAELADYFAGRRRDFSLPLAPAGTAFQRALWQALCTIPYGTVRTYSELARRLGSVPRAIGGACGRNPIPIIIPCHRVVAAKSLGGFSGGEGLATKCLLLRLESPDLLSGIQAQMGRSRKSQHS
ncbi:MAG: methylated-DNA--[protein]-cysteine S-methyltransferase [Alphaproteobacteria bacterium]